MASDHQEAPDAREATAPDDDVCWLGEWSVVGTRLDVWAQAAVNRTVSALVELHPFRLGDRKGAPRLVQWVAGQWSAANQPLLDELDGGLGLGLLSVTARDPELDRDEESAPTSTLDLISRPVRSVMSDSYRSLVTADWADKQITRWGGALVRLPKVWLPPIAWLPRAARGLDDPATSWPTESVDFDRRFSVHAKDVHTAAALLTPAVMAVLLDIVPDGCAVTISGDAVHLWWPYPAKAPTSGQAATAVRAAVRLVQSFPTFVLTEHPDVSGTVTARWARRAEDAREYQAQRRPGRSADPVMQRIYDEARARAGVPPPR